jgi:predicted ATP-dependent endonuclease of OLD family
MKLNYLDSSNLENQRGLEKVKVKFNKVNCIVGSNGSGKTRLLEQILEKLKKKNYEDFLNKSITDIGVKLQDFDVRQSEILGKEFYQDETKSTPLQSQVDINNRNFTKNNLNKNIVTYLDRDMEIKQLSEKDFLKEFEENIKELGEIWSIVEKERVSGYEHRAPNRKQKKNTNVNITTQPNGGCLLQFNKNTGKITIVKKDIVNDNISNTCLDLVLDISDIEPVN